MPDRASHTPVLLKEAVDGLSLRPDGVAIDVTLGSGGHFSALAENLGPNGILLGIDIDPIAVRNAKEKFARLEKDEKGPNTFFVAGNFRHVVFLARKVGIEYADAILADLGWRTEQFSGDEETGGGKGFSFDADEPLLMTLGDSADYAFTAADIVNDWKEEDIANVLKGYGEERYARRIARAIAKRREAKPVETAAELADIVRGAVPPAYRHGRINPATKTFQALRIAVNDELDALKELVASAVDLLSPNGTLAIISFHSIEDRIVKHAFAALEAEGAVQRITKKPIIPAEEELQHNPRARSARLRIARKA